MHRGSSFAAHVLVRHAKSVTEFIIWVEDTLPIIADQFHHDLIFMNFV